MFFTFYPQNDDTDAGPQGDDIIKRDVLKVSLYDSGPDEMTPMNAYSSGAEISLTKYIK
jgi:hypothetical protein